MLLCDARYEMLLLLLLLLHLNLHLCSLPHTLQLHNLSKLTSRTSFALTLLPVSPCATHEMLCVGVRPSASQGDSPEGFNVVTSEA